MRKYLLSIMIVLNACSTTNHIEEKEPPTIGPQLKLKGENEIEQWLKGEWQFSRSIDTTSRTVYRYHEDLGKQEILYSEDGSLTGCISYEIKKDYFTNTVNGKTTITHLIVEYIFDCEDGSVPVWNEFPIYREIEKINDNEYVWYVRGYPKGTPESDFLKNPRETGRAHVSGVVTATYMKRI